MTHTSIKICSGKHCCRSTDRLLAAAESKVRLLQAAEQIRVEKCLCLGECQKGPNLRIEQHGESTLHLGMSPHALERKVEEIAGKRPVIVPGKAKQSVNDLLRGGF